jgi:hypothetical protein
MKKITVALDDEVYIRLIDCVAAKSKKKSRLSVSESASGLIAAGLSRPALEGELQLS